MPEDDVPKVVEIETIPIKHAKDHKLLILVFSSVLISLLMVAVSLALYSSTGAEQLDLSRPGYVDARGADDVRPKSFEGFSPTGELDKTALDEFSTLYDAKLKEIIDIDAYSSDVLSPKSLGIK